jgi:hypothetical protein
MMLLIILTPDELYQIASIGCTFCNEGTYQSLTGQASCQLCPVHTYQPEDGQSTCYDCSTAVYEGESTCSVSCEPGMFVISSTFFWSINL